MKTFFMEIWNGILSAYSAYSSFVHSIFPSELGDLIVFVINVAVLCVIVKLVAGFAFKTHNE